MTTHALKCTCNDLVLGDASVPEIRQLLAAAKVPASELNSDLPPLQAITTELNRARSLGQPVDILHLIAHGQPGVLSFGDQRIDRAALLAHAGDLGCWGLRTIALWSCHVGADADFIALLEELTGAVVYSSCDLLERSVNSNVLSIVQHNVDSMVECIDLGDVVDLKIAPGIFNLASKRNKKFGRKRNRAGIESLNPDGFFYGVDTDNNVWQVDPGFNVGDAGNPFVKILELNDPLSPDFVSLPTKGSNTGSGSNGVAFDAKNRHLYFTYDGIVDPGENDEFGEFKNPPRKNWNIFWWPMKNKDYREEADWGWVQGQNFGSEGNPANAAFYDNSLWYFGEGQSENLYRLILDISGDEPPTAVRLVTYENIRDYSPGGYGDIAIRAEHGEDGEEIAVLYGSYGNGKLYRLNLSMLIQADSDGSNEDVTYTDVQAGFQVLVDKLGLNNPRYVKGEVELNEDYDCPSPPIPFNAENGLSKKNLQIAFDASKSNLIGQVYSGLDKNGNDKKGEIDFRGAYYSIANFQNLPQYDDDSGENPRNPKPSAYYTCYSSPDINTDIKYGFRDLGGSSTERIEPVPPNFGLEGLSANCMNNTKENDVYLAEFNYSITLEDLLVWSLRFCNNKSCGDGPAVAEFEYQLRLINDGESIPVDQYAIEELQFSEQENGDIDWGERDELLANDVKEGYFDFDFTKLDWQSINLDPPSGKAVIDEKNAVANIDLDVVFEGSGLIEALAAGDIGADFRMVLDETGNAESAKSVLEAGACGSVEEVRGSASCDLAGEQQGKVANFQFDVILEPVDLIQTYGYTFNADGLSVDGYDIRVEILVDGQVDKGDRIVVDIDQQGLATGLFAVDPGVEEFSVDVLLEAHTQLTGNETLELLVGNVDEQGEIISSTEQVDTVSLEGKGCKPGSITSITALAACDLSDTSNLQDATFTYTVDLDPGDVEKTYGYSFEALGAALQGYDLLGVDFGVEAGVVVLTPNQLSGQFEVPAGVKTFDVLVAVEAKRALTGQESLMFTVEDFDQTISADASLEDQSCPSVMGKVESVEGIAACELDGTVSEKDATFTFAVSFDPVGTEDQEYGYAFGSNKALKGYEILSVDFGVAEGIEVETPNETEGTMVVPGGVEEFEVVVAVEAKEKLEGDEALRLEIADQSSDASGKASLRKEECEPERPVPPKPPEPIVGEVVSVDGIAACEGEGFLKRNQATFTFDVDLISSDVDEIYNYRFKGSGFGSGKDYSIIDVELSPASEVDVRQTKMTDQARGALDVGAGVDDFSITVMVQADERLTGEETLNLKVSNDVSTATGVASLATHDCDDPSSVVAVDGLGYCELPDPDFDRDLEFTFAVTFDPGSPTLYGYELGVENMSLLADYSIQPLAITDTNGDAIDVEVMRDGDLSGTVLVGEGVEKALATFHVLSDGTLTGDEALTLTVGEPDAGGGVVPGTGVIGSVSAAEDIGSCAPGVVDVEASTSCSFDAGDDGVQADFSYEVILDPDSSGRHTYQYAFTSNGFEADDYNIEITYSSPDGEVVSRDLDRNRRQGEIQVGEGVAEINIDVSVTADGVTDETDVLTFGIKDKNGSSSAEATAVLSTQDCVEPLPDSSLLLLMDNSTSMLGRDPSTRKASATSSLEAQNRIAFYAFEQAADRAGYGFRRKGDASFESFGDASTDAILNNSTGNMAKTLGQYELVDNPNDGRQAGDLLVNQISFGYVVDEEETVIRSGGIGQVPVQGSDIAERILLTTTPNRIYGDSIDGNATWTDRDLPQPDDKDLFKGKGAAASNLYSGTEMLGALDGLQTLLNRRLRDGEIDEDGSTFVVMTTDGRPERRSWWDNREGKADGLAIPLPASLGGDSITASGLLYDSAGDWNYVPDDSGVNQWPKTRRRLNNTLDRLADVLIDPSEQLQVEAIGLGDDKGVDYQTIYDNLFTQQTFDNGNSSWIYDFFPSFNLPDFQG